MLKGQLRQKTTEFPNRWRAAAKSFSINGIPGFSRQEAPVKRTIRKFMKNM
ncbi:hypothetical protein SB48_HM08orf04101 [Heyndrickxia coagulans]|uniref:Uncharacterized protein n=1 Tax=Heyndrickxia coagulans TaxID=1398 RepID=A0AAN0WCQ8_HEYCO|nr:hypothetical protein SB48_HM08orf04101 [Heyndrickxia coagulans]